MCNSIFVDLEGVKNQNNHLRCEIARLRIENCNLREQNARLHHRMIQAMDEAYKNGFEAGRVVEFEWIKGV